MILNGWFEHQFGKLREGLINLKNAVTSLKSGYSSMLERHCGDIRYSPEE
jgi:hypothetical protein